MSASCQLDLDNEIKKNDETRKDVHFEALKPNYDWRQHAHDMVIGHNAPHNSVPGNLTGRIQTQKNPLPQKFSQPQNTTTHFSPDNTLPKV